MWLTKSLIPIMALNIVLYLLFRKYFGYIRTYLYLLIVALSIFMGYMLDMLGLNTGSYATPMIIGVFFALFVAMCVYAYLFDRKG